MFGRTFRQFARSGRNAQRSLNGSARHQRRGFSSATENTKRLPYGLFLMAAIGGGAGYLTVRHFEEEKSAPEIKVDNTAPPALRDAIVDLLDDEDHDDGSYGPLFVRLAWHSSGTYSKFDGTGGSNAGSMRFHPECAHGANAGLGKARERLEAVKKAFPNFSYGDIYTLAGAVAIEEMGGPKIHWRSGRVDGEAKDCTPDGRLPDASKGTEHVHEVFDRMGFTEEEYIALIGAHAIGRCHTTSSGYDGPWTFSPTTFSNSFFVNLLDMKWAPREWDGPKQFENEGKGLMMLPADMSLADDARGFRAISKKFAADEEYFFAKFAVAFEKLLELGVPAFQGDTAENKAIAERREIVDFRK